MIERLATAAVVAIFSVSAADAGYDTAMSAFKAGNFHEAAAEFQSMVEVSPDYACGWFMLGHTFVKMQRPADAEAMFRRALQINSSRFDFRHALAVSLKDQGRFQPAIQVLDAAEPLALERRSIYALRVLRGYLRVQLGAWPAAVEDLERARRISADPDLLDLLAQAYVGMFAFDSATAVLRDTLRVYPDRPDTTRLLIETLLAQARTATSTTSRSAFYDEAFGRAHRLALQRPEDPDVMNLLGRAALGAGQIDLANAALTQVMEREPRQCYVMVNLARVRIARGAYAGAEVLLRRATACAPRSAAVYETMGSGYLLQRRWSEAVTAFQRAVEIQPTPYAQAGLIEALKQLGASSAPPPSPANPSSRAVIAPRRLPHPPVDEDRR